MDVNLAKQLNILIHDMQLTLDRIIMDPTTGALGYGIEYGYSVMERLRIAALQGDSMTQMPMLVTPGEEAWKTKESKVGEGVPEAWGDWGERAINWEVITATSLIKSGADIVTLRHPESVNRVRKMIDEVRRLAWGMRPSILDDYGLDSALARHVEELSKHFGLAIDYQYSSSPGLGRLPRQIEVTLYRVAQEALTNIVRHARARQVSAVVLQQKEEVTLLIEDDGCGFDPKSKTDGNGANLGLTGMQERVALLGGTCAVESLAEQGTTIRVNIPLSGVSECLSAS